MRDLLDAAKLSGVEAGYLLFDGEWPIIQVDPGTGLLSMDVCGMPQNAHWDGMMNLADVDGNVHDVYDYYLEEDENDGY